MGGVYMSSEVLEFINTKRLPRGYVVARLSHLRNANYKESFDKENSESLLFFEWSTEIQKGTSYCVIFLINDY